MYKVETHDDPVYIQDKLTGKIWEGDITLAQHRDPKWNMRHRRVRLYHHPESDSIFCEDWHTPDWQRADVNGECSEIDLEQFTWLKSLYDNPDL